MNETLEITTEQINDLPLLMGLVEEMGIRQRIDAQVRPHGRWQGISVGTVVSIWLCHLLMERDHRLVGMRQNSELVVVERQAIGYPAPVVAAC
jgi:hypothetical protein